MFIYVTWSCNQSPSYSKGHLQNMLRYKGTIQLTVYEKQEKCMIGEEKTE
jgi:hypothetical protein